MNRKYYIANLYINCKGEASVSYLCDEKNINGTYLSGDFNDSNITLYDDEVTAIKRSRQCGMDYSVHFKYI